jgi:hypothetical protein
MPLIESPRKVTKKGLSVQLPVETLEQLRAYAEFVGGDLGYVVDQMLLHVMQKDKDFQKSLAKPAGSENVRAIA